MNFNPKWLHNFTWVASISLWLAVVVGVQIAPYAASAQSQDRGARWHYNRGGDLLEAKEYNECIQESKQAIELDPTLDGAYCNLGAAYYKKGMLPEAEAALRKAYEMNPQRAATRQNLALVYEALSDPKADNLWESLPGSVQQQEERRKAKIYRLVTKGTLTSEDITWLAGVARSDSKLRESAAITLGMALMDHPEMADTLAPVLIQLHHAWTPDKRWLIVALIGGAKIRLDAPSALDKDIALIAPEFTLARHDLIRSSSGGSQLPKALRTNETIIGFLCSVLTEENKLGSPSVSLGYFQGETARQCLAAKFEKGSNEDTQTALAGSLLRLGDTRGVPFLLSRLQRMGKVSYVLLERDLQTFAATGFEPLLEAVESLINLSVYRIGLLRERYARGDEKVASKIVIEQANRSKHDMEILYNLSRTLGDWQENDSTYASKFSGFVHTTPLLVAALEHGDDLSRQKTVTVLNIIARTRLAPSSLEYPGGAWIPAAFIAANDRLPADIAEMDASGWLAWYAKHKDKFAPGVPPHATYEKSFGPIEPIHIDETVVSTYLQEFQKHSRSMLR